MSRPSDDPWTKVRTGAPGSCAYGCGMPATLREPGTGRAAHKVCALAAAEGLPVPPESHPLGNWDGEEHKATPDGPYGCGDEASKVVMGRRCAETGTIPACQLCPLSPTYWDPDGRWHPNGTHVITLAGLD